MHAQLTHHVSISAANHFWSLAFKYVGHLLQLKSNENINKKIPQFIQTRKVTYQEICPDVKMSFAFFNKSNNSIVHVQADHTPISQYQGDPNFQKLYEEAHIEVRNNIY